MAIEIVLFSIQHVIFHSYVTNYQRVIVINLLETSICSCFGAPYIWGIEPEQKMRGYPYFMMIEACQAPIKTCNSNSNVTMQPTVASWYEYIVDTNITGYEFWAQNPGILGTPYPRIVAFAGCLFPHSYGKVMIIA